MHIKFKNNRHAALTLIALMGLSSGCAINSVKTENRQPSSAAAVLPADGAPAPNDLSDNGTDLVGIPIEVNRLVLKWIDYFQGQGRPHMERYLSRSSRYSPMMKEILKKEGLPEDLIYIALIESGFSSSAHSSANAVGYWQFIRGTGRRYGLKIDSFVDERRDFVLATRAAADYFKGLYNLFGAWYLAIASYNVGENRVKNLVMKNKTRDFWKLARENRLPQETVNYVPKFLAARLIAKEPEKYGFTEIDYLPAIEFDTAEFDKPVDLKKLAEGIGVEFDDIRDLNPMFKRAVAPLPRAGKLNIRVPKGMLAKANDVFPQSVASTKMKYAAEDDYSFYRVRRGDTVSSIARHFSLKQTDIMRLNQLSSRSVLSVGKRLRLPVENLASLGGPSKEFQAVGKEAEESDRQPASKKSRRAKKASERASQSTRRTIVSHRTFAAHRASTHVKQHKKVHVVRNGENLAAIAQKYRVSVRNLADQNGLRRQSVLYVGKRLEIP